MRQPRVYFAPMEGITNAVYRRVHARRFSGVDKYFMPFVSPAKHLTFSSKERYELAPENNIGMRAVPQILTKDAGLFNDMAKLLSDMGYVEINLNLGCPSPTVTSKNKGSGMLKDVAELRRFLDAIFAKPAVSISVKTRVGFFSLDEWPELAEVFKAYPIGEIIVHPRTRGELYSGKPHWECLDEIDGAPFPVVPNGNLFTRADCERIINGRPDRDRVMLGRGLVANPALAREIKGAKAIGKDELKGFHDELFDSYLSRWPDGAVVGHMHEIMNYVMCCFKDADKQKKAVRKSRSREDYAQAVNRLFDECELNERPGYAP